MAALQYLLWGYFLVYPIYIYLSHEEEKASVIAQPKKRLVVYRLTMLYLWLPVLVLFVVVNQTSLSMHDLGIRWQWSLANQIATIGLLSLCGYFIFSLKQLSTNNENHQEILNQLVNIKWFMPTTNKEARYFIFGLSITAGICEELLFRGYLLHILSEYLPTYAAVFLSSLAFGLGHIYQGRIHVLRTTILGAVMALIYLATDTIIVPIILHAMLDIYGGVMAYIVLQKHPHNVLDVKLKVAEVKKPLQ